MEEKKQTRTCERFRDSHLEEQTRDISRDLFLK